MKSSIDDAQITLLGDNNEKLGEGLGSIELKLPRESEKVHIKVKASGYLPYSQSLSLQKLTGSNHEFLVDFSDYILLTMTPVDSDGYPQAVKSFYLDGHRIGGKELRGRERVKIPPGKHTARATIDDEEAQHSFEAKAGKAMSIKLVLQPKAP